MTEKGLKKYWFFRSIFVSSVVFALVLAFVFGAARCYSIMEHTLTGEEKKAVEIKEGELYLLGERLKFS